MIEFLEFVVKHIVDNPEQVEIELEEQDAKTILFKLKVAPEDTGKVIGKGGKTARSLRVILTAVASKTGKKVSLKILD